MAEQELYEMISQYRWRVSVRTAEATIRGDLEAFACLPTNIWTYIETPVCEIHGIGIHNRMFTFPVAGGGDVDINNNFKGSSDAPQARSRVKLETWPLGSRRYSENGVDGSERDIRDPTRATEGTELYPHHIDLNKNCFGLLYTDNKWSDYDNGLCADDCKLSADESGLYADDIELANASVAGKHGSRPN